MPGMLPANDALPDGSTATRTFTAGEISRATRSLPSASKTKIEGAAGSVPTSWCSPPKSKAPPMSPAATTTPDASTPSAGASPTTPSAIRLAQTTEPSAEASFATTGPSLWKVCPKIGSVCEVTAPTRTFPAASIATWPRPREVFVHTCVPSWSTRTTSVVLVSVERQERKTASPFAFTASSAPSSGRRFSQRSLPSGSSLTRAAAGVAPSPKSMVPLQPESAHCDAQRRYASPFASVARVVPGSTFAPADPSKALVQIEFPAESSLLRLTPEGSTTSATVFPDGSAAMATTSLPPDETQPDVFGGGGGVPSKAAPTCRSEPTVTWQVPVPEHAPVQPEKVEPGAGVAVRATLALSSNWAEQAAPQSIPAGAEEIRPEPAPDGVTVTVCLPT